MTLRDFTHGFVGIIHGVGTATTMNMNIHKSRTDVRSLHVKNLTAIGYSRQRCCRSNPSNVLPSYNNRTIRK
jgi:hypothetical protein